MLLSLLHQEDIFEVEHADVIFCLRLYICLEPQMTK